MFSTEGIIFFTTIIGKHMVSYLGTKRETLAGTFFKASLNNASISASPALAPRLEEDESLNLSSLRSHNCRELGWALMADTITSSTSFVAWTASNISIYIHTHTHTAIIAIWSVLYMWPSTGKPGTTRHPSKKNFCCTYRVVGVQILSSPSFIVVA